MKYEKMAYFNGKTGETAYLVPENAGGLTGYPYTVCFLFKSGEPFKSLEAAIKWLEKNNYK